MTDTELLLEDLSTAFGPPGFEDPVRATMRRELTPLSDTIGTDGIGSLITCRNGLTETPKIMLSDHMDEVELMVKYITVPTRYLHRHNSLISRNDFDKTVDLVTELVRRLDADNVTSLGRFN